MRRILFFFLFIPAFIPFVFAENFAGKIMVKPPFPEMKRIEVNKDMEHCGQHQQSVTLIISAEGELKNAVVSLNPVSEMAEVASAPLLVSTTVINQRNCQFEPHILLIPHGQEFQFMNSDSMTHDVRIFDGAAMLTRFEMEDGDNAVPQRLDKPGRFLIRCGLHPWMFAYVVSASHPYVAVTDEKGGFQIPDVPAGNYELSIWHEELGEMKQPMELKQSVDSFLYMYDSAANKDKA